MIIKDKIYSGTSTSFANDKDKDIGIGMGSSRNKIYGASGALTVDSAAASSYEVPVFFSPQYKNSSVRGPFFDPIRTQHDVNRLRAEQ